MNRENEVNRFSEVNNPYEPEKGVIPIGSVNHRDETQMVGMRNAELDKHMLAVGKTGFGKTEWLKWMVHGIVKDDYPVVVIDPYDQVSSEIFWSLISKCPERSDDIIFLDFTDGDHPIGLNPFDVASEDQVEGAVAAVKQMFSSLLAGSVAPRAVGYVEEAAAALCHANLKIDNPQAKSTIFDIPRFFQDPEFRQVVVASCRIEAIRKRYDHDSGPFEMLGLREQSKQTEVILRVFGQLERSPAFQDAFSNPENKVKFPDLITSNKIVLVKLSRFGYGERNLGAAVGSLILTWLLSSRHEWGKTKDPMTGDVTGSGCRLVVDASPHVMKAGSCVPHILAEARKWDLGMILAAQYLGEFDDSVRDGVLANTCSKISMNQDPAQAELIAKSLSSPTVKVEAEEIASQPCLHFLGNVLVPDEDGISASGPFSAKCLPVMKHNVTDKQIAAADEVRQRSRELTSTCKVDLDKVNQRRIADLMSELKKPLKNHP